MSSALIEATGWIAGALTTLAFVPQVLKTWRSHHADDLSLGMLAIFVAGIILWLVYGIAVVSWPLILSNIVTLGLTGVLLYLKLQQVLRRASDASVTSIPMGQPADVPLD